MSHIRLHTPDCKTSNEKWKLTELMQRLTLELTQMKFLVCVVKVAHLKVVQPRIQCSQAFSRHLQSLKTLRCSPKDIETQSQRH